MNGKKSMVMINSEDHRSTFSSDGSSSSFTSSCFNVFFSYGNACCYFFWSINAIKEIISFYPMCCGCIHVFGCNYASTHTRFRSEKTCILSMSKPNAPLSATFHMHCVCVCVLLLLSTHSPQIPFDSFFCSHKTIFISDT